MSPTAESYLDIRQVSKQYGGFWALKDVSLNIGKGEFVCFLGPSGCGKTTLLRIIAGLETETSGTIFQDGEKISDRPTSERDFGIVFQSYALFPNLTVEANVGYGLVNQGLKKRDIAHKVEQLLQLVDLVPAKSKFPSELSGGMQQRVALARALALSPSLLLLDEPLSALDARVRTHLRTEIRRLHDRLGITTIMVTHDQEEALTMADRIVVMNQGGIEQVGTPEEIYATPHTPFVAEFVGLSNRITAKVTDTNVVDWAGHSVGCSLPGHCQAGDKVILSVRPEHIRLSVDLNDQANGLAAQVHGIEFLGPFCRITLKADHDVTPLVADLRADQVRDLRLRAGQNLSLHLAPDRITVFREPASA